MEETIKILHLEDFAADAEMVDRELKKSKISYEIRIVSNKADFIQSLKTLSPDIILADHSLPRFNSIEALKIIRDMALKVPFILLTGTTSEENAVSIMLQGAEDYIIKDRLQRLPSVILKAVERYRKEKAQMESQVRAAKRIAESERRYREIVETAQEGIWITNHADVIIFSNKKMGEILGYTVSEIVGQPISNFHADEVGKPLDILPPQSSSNNKYECRFRSKSGNIIWVSISISIIHDTEHESVHRKLSMISDITERKNADEELQHLHDALQKTIAELAVSNKELERFAYIASHDLQEPLRMVTSFLQRLLVKYGGELDETAKKYIAFAADGAGRMKDLINSLLEFSRVSTIPKETTIILLDELITKTLLDLKPDIDSTGAAIILNVPQHIIGNRVQLSQLFQNLISNALKYKRDIKPQIEIGFTEDEAFWRFFVADNGLGIDPENFEKIFVIFQRLHNRSEYPGTGIGLSICKKIVELHGGEIWLTSKKGEGSTFHFTLSKLAPTSLEIKNLSVPN